MGTLRTTTDPQGRFTTKNDRLTYTELDQNFIDILDRVDGLVDGGVNRIQLSDGGIGLTSVNDFLFDAANSTLVINGTSGAANTSLSIYGQTTTASAYNTIIRDSSNNILFRFSDTGTLDIVSNTGTIKVANVANTSTIDTPQAGMLIYNTTDSEFQGYDGSAWGSITGGGGGTAPGLAGAILFSGGGGSFSEDYNNLYYSTLLDRMGIGTTTPTAKLTIKSSGNTSSSRSFTIFNSDDREIIDVADNGDIVINKTAGLLGLIDFSQRSDVVNMRNTSIGTSTIPAGSLFTFSMVNGGTQPGTLQENTFMLYADDYQGNPSQSSPYFITEDNKRLSVRDAATKTLTLDYFPSLETVKLLSIDKTENTEILSVNFNLSEIDSVSYRTRNAGSTTWNTEANIGEINDFITNNVTLGNKFYLELTVIFDVAWNQEAQVSVNYLA